MITQLTKTMMAPFVLYSCMLLSACVLGRMNFVDFEKIGGIPGNKTLGAQWWNFKVLNTTLSSLSPSTTLFFPNKAFHLIGGVKARRLAHITFIFDGTLIFSDDRTVWPLKANGEVEECIYIERSTDLVFTSTGTGTLDGNGKKWWGSIKYLKHAEDRPRLIHLNMTTNVLVERLLLKNSPYWTFFAENSFSLTIRHTDVSARWTDQNEHTPLDLQAYNTDGFDVSGKHVHIHDCTIWNQDDCIAVKSNSEHMLFERISCSGLGLVIGSIGNARVHNITFRDSVMPRTFKGIYLKTRWNDSGPVLGEALISDILYQNITMDRPQQYPIWIGPAQQTGQPCDLRWPQGPNAECRMSGYQTWKNIVLRDIFINNPDNSPGVLISNASNPMRGVVFDNVVVTSPGKKPFGPNYHCEGMKIRAIGATSPLASCMFHI